MAGDGHEVLFIKVTGQQLVHTDHPVNLEQWRMYSQNRAAVMEHPYLTHEADLMLRTGSNKRAARAHIESLTGKVCTTKDMHNLCARLNKREKIKRAVGVVHSQPHRTAIGTSLNAGTSQNLLHQSKSARVEPVLQAFVDADVENHLSILSGDDGSNEATCLASRAMKEHFAVFPELLVLDVVMSKQATVEAEQDIHGFLCMDALGNVKPVFLIRSMPMSASLLRRACQDFKRTHPMWIRTKVLVINKLLPDAIQVLTQEFPQTQMMLCQFHVLRLFTGLLGHYHLPDRVQATNPQSANIIGQDKIRETFKQLVFAESNQQYNDTRALLTRQLTTGGKIELLAEFDRRWDPFRSLWASYARTEQFDFSSFFTKGMSSFWEPVRSAFRRSRHSDATATAATNVSHPSTATATGATNPLAPHASPRYDGSQLGSMRPKTYLPVTFRCGISLANSMYEVLTTITFIESEWEAKMRIFELTKPVAVDHFDPMLHLLTNCISSFAVDLISSQLTIQSLHTPESVTVTKTQAPMAHIASCRVDANETSKSHDQPATGATVRWLSKKTREKHVLQRDGSACDCGFFALYRLPCRHLIWYEVVTLQHKQLSMAAVSSRWFLRSFQTPKLSTQRESNEIEYHLL
ncbi:unnamed protein product [Phytophthora lilii]|uniref:Unnamed protein product n=1 Tax=Phytophthora lilii TaxID=2077276 RepID=A0A9W6TCY2_9STRA|nr:unnamed protein product [Phytophthora lilii]